MSNSEPDSFYTVGWPKICISVGLMLCKINYSGKWRQLVKQCAAVFCFIFSFAIVTSGSFSFASSEDWNFTRRDFINHYKKGGHLQFDSDSNWLPVPLKKNIVSTIEFILSPKNTVATAKGVNVIDFFHGHVGCRRSQILPPETSIVALLGEFGYGWAYSTINREFRNRFGMEAGDIKPSLNNISHYITTVLETEKRLSLGIEENILRCQDLGIVYHTNEFELDQEFSDPRRNVVTDQVDLKPRHFTPRTANASSWMLEYEPLLNIAFLIDKNGVIHVTYGYVNELSRVTGKPETEPNFVKAKPNKFFSIENFQNWLR